MLREAPLFYSARLQPHVWESTPPRVAHSWEWGFCVLRGTPPSSAGLRAEALRARWGLHKSAIFRAIGQRRPRRSCYTALHNNYTGNYILVGSGNNTPLPDFKSLITLQASDSQDQVILAHPIDTEQTC